MKIQLIVCILGLMFYGLIGYSQSVDITSNHPKAGEAVTFTYHPADGPLSASEVEGVAYLFEGDSPVAIEISLTKGQSGYSGEVNLTEGVKAFFLSFSNAKQDKRDNNDDQGYQWIVYEVDGKTPVKGAYASLASAYVMWPRMIGIKRMLLKA